MTHGCTSRTPQSAENVFLLLLGDAGMRFRILMYHDEKRNAPDSSNSTEHIEYRRPTARKSVLGEKATQRHGNNSTELCTCDKKTNKQIRRYFGLVLESQAENIDTFVTDQALRYVKKKYKTKKKSVYKILWYDFSIGESPEVPEFSSIPSRHRSARMCVCQRVIPESSKIVRSCRGRGELARPLDWLSVLGSVTGLVSLCKFFRSFSDRSMLTSVNEGTHPAPLIRWYPLGQQCVRTRHDRTLQ